jgi:hypothetical protein
VAVKWEWPPSGDLRYSVGHGDRSRNSKLRVSQACSESPSLSKLGFWGNGGEVKKKMLKQEL